jgi:hypothetical protein
MRRVTLCALILLLTSSCGGDSGSPTGPDDSNTHPEPVATVSVAPPQLLMVPHEEAQAAASPLDASGGELTEREVVWTSSDESVATVSSTGLVTAQAEGSATITATSEGKEGELAVEVVDGGRLNTEGGDFDLADGAIHLSVPQGAAPAGTILTAVETADVPPPPGSYSLTGAAAFKLGPEGQTFDEPVVVTLHFDPDDLPPWLLPEGLQILRWDGSEWHPLANVVVDAEAGTISGETEGFSTFVPSFELPSVTVTPSPGSVNELQRSVVLTAQLDEGDVVDANYDFGEFIYNWSTTGMNGEILESEGNHATYLATIPVLPDGEFDQVTADVQGVGWDDGSIVDIGSAIDGELQTTIDLLPESSETSFSGQVELSVVIQPPTGADLVYEWSSTDNHGSIDAPQGQKIGSKSVTYTAKSAEESVPSPPRVDRVDVTVYRAIKVQDGLDDFETVYKELGTRQAFVEIAGDKLFGSWGTETEDNCAFAYIYVPKVVGAQTYNMHAYNYTDWTGFWGTEIRRTWGATGGAGVEDLGTEWRFFLSSGCNGGGAGKVVSSLESRFNGMKVDVLVGY